MSDTRTRLEQVFANLRDLGITPAFVLTGSTGVREDRLQDYTRAAAQAGTPGRWVGDHIGSSDHGGGYWDADGVLRYRYNDRPVADLLFSFAHGQSDIPATLLDVLRAEGFDASWDSDPYSCVEVNLTGEALQ